MFFEQLLFVYSIKNHTFAIRLRKRSSYGKENISTVDPQEKKQAWFP